MLPVIMLPRPHLALLPSPAFMVGTEHWKKVHRLSAQTIESQKAKLMSYGAAEGMVAGQLHHSA